MPDRFTIRWDGHQYKVSEPNIGTVKVVTAEKYDRAVRAVSTAYEALTRAEDLGPNVNEDAVHIARDALAGVIVEGTRG